MAKTTKTTTAKTVATRFDRLALRLTDADKRCLGAVADAIAAQQPKAAPWARLSVSEIVRVALRAAEGMARAGTLVA